MALIKCPECNHSISNTVNTCPNCGYSIAFLQKNPHVPKISVLSKKKTKGLSKSLVSIIGSCILIAAGIPLIALGIGVILIILGIVGFCVALTEVNKYQYGACPYCRTELRVKSGNAEFKCPVCNNVGKQTETTLETTHDFTH